MEIALDDGTELCSGTKYITGYEIDTQAMHLVEMFQITAQNTDNSEDMIKKHLVKIKDDTEYKLIEL